MKYRKTQKQWIRRTGTRLSHMSITMNTELSRCFVMLFASTFSLPLSTVQYPTVTNRPPVDEIMCRSQSNLCCHSKASFSHVPTSGSSTSSLDSTAISNADVSFPGFFFTSLNKAIQGRTVATIKQTFSRVKVQFVRQMKSLPPLLQMLQMSHAKM